MIYYLYFFVYSQIIQLFTVDYSDIAAVADSLFFFFMQLVLIPKLYWFLKNTERIRALLNQLESPIFMPSNEDEEKSLDYSIFMTRLFHRVIVGLSYQAIVSWLLTVMNGVKPTMVPAQFPWSYEGGFGFWFTLFYQFGGISHSALTHTALDTMVMGLMFHITGQLYRLGTKLSKVS